MKKAKEPKIYLRQLIKHWAAPIGCGLLFLFLLNSVFFFGYVPSDSMAPVIKEGSFILAIRTYGELKQGDVVVFYHENRLLVKRIAGVPGDTVVIRDEELTVPDGCYFLLGDNSDHSIDSRDWEEPFVNRKQVVARVSLGMRR